MSLQTAATSVSLVLAPLDVLFFRDGRPFGAAGQAQSLLMPLPQTLSGAISTALLESHGAPMAELGKLVQSSLPFEEALNRLSLPTWLAHIHVRGPFLARRPRHDPATPPELLFPAPANLVRFDQDASAVSLLPTPEDFELPGWSSTRSGQRGLRALWYQGRDKPEPVRGFLTQKGMQTYLRGNPVPDEDIVSTDSLLQYDRRTGIAIEPTFLTAREQHIYSASFLALCNDPRQAYEVVFCAEVIFPDARPEPVWPESRTTIAWGGEGKRVVVETLEAEPSGWTCALDSHGAASTSDYPFIVLTTPAIFGNRWCPAALEPQIVAAAIGPAIAVSGWDLAKQGPKPSRHAVPAGSVYFLDRSVDSLPTNLADAPEDRRQGWGCYLQGVWNHDSGH